MVKNLLVYCGSAPGNRPEYAHAANQLGYLLAEKKIRLIYGGGRVGLMGILADRVLEQGGKVTGIIPQFLSNREMAHNAVQDMHIVQNMHERKALMEKLSDAVLALPGGFGTLDELFEMLTWSQLGIHNKPIVLLNTIGYYDLFLQQLAYMTNEGFVKQESLDKLIVVDTPEQAVIKLLTN